MPARAAPAATGFTMIELMIAVSITVALGAIASPSLAQLVSRHRLQEAAHGLQSDLAQARHVALRLGMPVWASFQPGAKWCYALSVGQPVNCHGPTPGVQVLNIVHASRYPQVQMLQADTMALDGRSGLAQANQGQLPKAVLASQHGQRVEVRLGAMGRASLCNPDRAQPGHGACIELAEP